MSEMDTNLNPSFELVKRVKNILLNALYWHLRVAVIQIKTNFGLWVDRTDKVDKTKMKL